MKISPRITQYALKLSDVELDAIVAVPAKTVDLQGADATSGSKLLGDALRDIFLPDNQAREILRHFVSLANAHAAFHFDTDEKYIAGLYSRTPWGTARSPAICFTGPAGAGKSEILHALTRLLTRSDSFSVEGHRDIPLVPAWAMTLAKGDGLNQLLREHVETPSGHLAVAGSQARGARTHTSKDWRIPDLLRSAERVSWRGATCLGSIDEFQWIAAGSSANARAASVLLKLHGVGPLLVFCSNYSLVHKLTRRGQEDRDRLLTSPVVLEPLAADDPDWTAYLVALRSVAPDVLMFDPEQDGESIHLYSFGIKRKVVDLVVVAFQLARRRKATATVGAKELLLAYQSADYAMHREDVEILIRQQVTGKMEREDLWCPFAPTGTVASNVKRASPIVESFERRTEEALLAAALLPNEAAAHDKVKPAPPEKGGAKVLRFRAQKVTKESLLAGAAALDAFE